MQNDKPFIPEKKTLMGPGPSDVSERVLQAMARPTIGHLDPQFIQLMDQIKSLLQRTFRTKNELTFPVSGPGSAGMEACIVNLVEPGDEVAVCVNGVFGTRMAEVVRRCGGTPLLVENAWGEAADPNRLEEVLSKHANCKHVAFVHAETSTGVLSDANTLSQVAQAHGCLTIVDTVTSLGGVDVNIDEWKVDAVYSGSQKCLSCPPGLSPVSFSERAVQAVLARKSPVQSWFLDIGLLTSYWSGGQKRAYHHTAPINALYGLHEALLVLHEEGLDTAIQRHRENHELLKAKLNDLGLEFFVAPEIRLPQLNAIKVPEGIDEAQIRSALLNEHKLEIGAGLGPLAGKIWRIGLMGHASSRKNIETCVSALRTLLQ